ncbi:MAG TPA: ATP-binding protein [Thermodesulfobacteriota bacterium]
MGKTLILETIAREMRSGVLVLDKGGEALYANPSFLKSFLVHGGIEGKPVTGIIKNESLLKKINAFLEKRRGSPENVEISERSKSFNVRLVPIKEKADFSLLLFLQDITEEKRLETIKKDFVANVSHELRTPLASIKGYSETLLDGGMDDRETLREFLRVIDRHSTRMSRLIDDLLTLSRLESHQMTIVSAPVDLKELVHAIMTGFEKQARDKDITLSSTIPEGLLKALGDHDRLEQVLVNLLDNAIKYTHSGGSVTVTVHKDRNDIRVDVKDTGIGIPADDIPRIFERFYRVDKARSRELGGTGLGLAIVKHIIQGHNGKLSVKSTPGAGSTFSFSIKACK